MKLTIQCQRCHIQYEVAVHCIDEFRHVRCPACDPVSSQVMRKNQDGVYVLLPNVYKASVKN